MQPVEIALLVSTVLSLVSIPLLILVFVPRVLPARVTCVRDDRRLSAAGGSLVVLAGVYAGLYVLDFMAQERTGSLICSVDAILKTYFKTAISAHIAVIAFNNSSLIPSPSRPDPVSSAGRSAALLSAAYLYGIFPLIPNFKTVAAFDWEVEEGFGKWWGAYCIDRSSWFRIVQSVTLLLPLALSVILCVVAFSSHYSNVDHPSDKIRPTMRQWITTVYLLFCVCSAMAYLIAEQILGWHADWWPRVFEALLPLLVFLPYSCERHVWRTWGCWIRFKRVPTIDPSSPPTRPGGPTRQGSRDIEKNIASHWTSTSSFFAPQTPIHDTYKSSFMKRPSFLLFRPPVAYNNQRLGLARGGAAPMLYNASPVTPPFVYSVAETETTSRTGSTADLLPVLGRRLSPVSESSPVLSPQSTWHPKPPPPLMLAPAREGMDDAMSLNSRYSDMSGITSVFGTRHSIASSLPGLSEDTHNAHNVQGDVVVFYGDSTKHDGPHERSRATDGGHSKLSVIGSLYPMSPGSIRTDESMETLQSVATKGSEGSHRTFGRKVKTRGGVI